VNPVFKGLGWTERPSSADLNDEGGSVGCDVFVALVESSADAGVVGEMLDNAGVSFTSTEELADSCRIFLYELDAVQTPKAASIATERICTGQQVLLVDGGGGDSGLKQHLQKIAANYGVPCFANVKDAVDAICSGASAKTSSPGKQVYIAARQKFRDNEALLSAASAWQDGEIDGVEAVQRTESCQEEKLKGMSIKPLSLANPIFTHFVESTTKPQPEVVFYEDADLMIFPNVKVGAYSSTNVKVGAIVFYLYDVFVTSDHSLICCCCVTCCWSATNLLICLAHDTTHCVTQGHSRKHFGAAAAMSQVHFLAIPKARIYNTVMLTVEHVPLLEKMVTQATAVLQSEKLRCYYNEGEGRDLDLAPSAFDPSHLRFYVHLHPYHSVGHLHIHCILDNLLTQNGEALMYKNTDLKHILGVLMAGKPPLRSASVGSGLVAEDTAESAVAIL
jgi:hypothetical protein